MHNKRDLVSVMNIRLQRNQCQIQATNLKSCSAVCPVNDCDRISSPSSPKLFPLNLTMETMECIHSKQDRDISQSTVMLTWIYLMYISE